MKNEELDNAPMDVEHELPQGDAGGDTAVVSEVERLKSENAFQLDRLARLQAEFENFRKRNLREQQEFREYALTDALKQLLPILDSLDRAVKTESKSVEDLRSGVELIDRQFHDVLTRLGVEPIQAQGQPFDPSLHQAIQMVETTEVPDHHVLDELQRGYRLRDRVLRAAMVRVAQNRNGQWKWVRPRGSELRRKDREGEGREGWGAPKLDARETLRR
jgi:molecular chaperone GrpE